MEKGFNDDELADIMSEIESLEQEFADDDSDNSEEIQASADQIENVESEVEEDEQEEFVAKQEEPEEEEQYSKPHHQQPAAKVDAKMHDVLDELSEMPVDDVVPQQKIHKYDDNIHHMKQQAPQASSQSGNPASTSMSFRVEGEMKLDLNFCIGGQSVALQVSDKGFEIELAGGAKFTLPLGVHNQGHKAA